MWSTALAVIGIVTCFGSAIPADAQSAGRGTISGIVADQISGLPVADATITLYAGDSSAATQKSDSRGSFSFSNVTPGVYRLIARVTGYTPQSTGDVAVLSGQQVIANFALTKSSGIVSENLRTIATTRVSAGNAIASTTTITRTLDPTLLTDQGYIRFGDQLRTLPGVNLGGLSSSVGDDLYVDIRGMGESETQALLDGHPVGPIGVYARNGGGSYPSSFNFADTPTFVLSKVQVTFGSGATGLYGTDAIGGTINMETLHPTPERHYEAQYGAGDQGKQQASFTATGTLGRLGYALGGGIVGTYGLFSPQTIAQTGRPNNNSNLNNGGACLPNPPPSPFKPSSGAPYNYTDLTSCNLALNTYAVSQNTSIRTGLAKLEYALSKNTTLSGDWFASSQWADSTGNGDNDNMPYDTRLAQVQAAQPGLDPSIQCSLPADKPGATSGIVVATDGNAAACYSPQQVAAASYGPFGGGAGRARGTMMFDYHTRLQTVSGRSTYTADYFFNHYKYFKTSEDASGFNPDGTCCAGTVYSQFLNSQGLLLSDNIVWDKGELGFGWFSEHQLQTRLNFQFTGQGLYSYTPAESPAYGSVFARGSYTFTPTLSAFANLWAKHSNTDNITSFDPRVSVVFRPASGHDVYRVTYGKSTGDPAAELVNGGVVINGNPSSLNPSCTPYNNVGSGSNPSIAPEVGHDLEVGYAHRFTGDSSVQLNLYQTRVSNQMFAASLPLTQYSGSYFIPPDLLAGFASKISSAGCPGVNSANPNSVLPYLSISTTYNAASALYSGIELSGRQRFSRRFYVDYTYDVQHAVQNGINDNILQNNPFIINGAQIAGIPYGQGTLGFDYSTPDGWQAEADGYFVSRNNVSSRPAYSFWSGFVGKTLQKGFTVRVGVFNIFNQATQNYGYFGHQQLVPENQFFNDTTPIQQFVSTGSGEEFGLASRSFVVNFVQSL